MVQKIYLAYAGDEVVVGEVVNGGRAQIDADMSSRTIEEIADNLIGDYDELASITLSIR